jgi:hypothetical protein
VPRNFPSQAVKFIDSVFHDKQNLGRGNAGVLSALISIVDQIPPQLLVMDELANAGLLGGVGQIREALKRWAADRSSRDALDPVPGFNGKYPVELIRDALFGCPDEYPAASTADLAFISDPDLRLNLRTDIDVIRQALQSGEWKAATVLAGSAIEALLLWSLQPKTPPEITAAVAAVVGVGKPLSNTPDKDLNRWSLHEYIEVAFELKIIKERTAIQCRLARDYRNLIHPGKSIRLKLRPTVATAMSAVAGLEHVIENLTP